MKFSSFLLNPWSLTIPMWVAAAVAKELCSIAEKYRQFMQWLCHDFSAIEFSAPFKFNVHTGEPFGAQGGT